MCIYSPFSRSCAQIARLIGFPKHSRMVGNALKVLPRHLATPTLPQAAPGPRPARPATDEGDLSDEQPAASASAIEPLFAPATDDEAEGDQPDDDVLPEPEPNPDFVPWHRVLAASGVISPRGSLAAVMRQADYLRAEGVEVAGAPEQGDGRVGHGVLGQGGVDGGRVSMAMYRWDGEE